MPYKKVFPYLDEVDVMGPKDGSANYCSWWLKAIILADGISLPLLIEGKTMVLFRRRWCSALVAQAIHLGVNVSLVFREMTHPLSFRSKLLEDASFQG